MGLLLPLTQEMIKSLTDDMPNKLALRNKSPIYGMEFPVLWSSITHSVLGAPVNSTG